MGENLILSTLCLSGIRPVDFLGNFYMSNTTDVELATVDCDKSITCEIKHDDKLNESEGAVIQVTTQFIDGFKRFRMRLLYSRSKAAHFCRLCCRNVYTLNYSQMYLTHCVKIRILPVCIAVYQCIREEAVTNYQLGIQLLHTDG